MECTTRFSFLVGKKKKRKEKQPCEEKKNKKKKKNLKSIEYLFIR